jgi:hypothetical protein
MPLQASDHYNNNKVEPWLVADARELTQTKETEKTRGAWQTGQQDQLQI